MYSIINFSETAINVMYRCEDVTLGTLNNSNDFKTVQAKVINEGSTLRGVVEQ